MKLKSFLSLVLCGTLISGVSFASDDNKPVQLENSSSQELTAKFKDYCLDRFLDKNQQNKLAEQRKDHVLTTDEVKRYLHQDPGYGWKENGEKYSYTITIETPPVQACAVRSITNNSSFNFKPLNNALSDYLTQHQYKIAQLKTRTIPNFNGMSIVSIPFIIVNKELNPIETILIFFTKNASNKSANPDIEIRFVHQVIKNPKDVPTLDQNGTNI